MFKFKETTDKCENGSVSSYPVKFNHNLTQFNSEHLPDHRSQASKNSSLPNLGLMAPGFNANFQEPKSHITVTALLLDGPLDFL